MSVRSYARAHRVIVTTVALLAIGLVVFVAYWFQPQKLILERTVNEAAPLTSSPTPTAGTSAATGGDVASGRFRSLEHRTTGTVRVIALPDGGRVLRIENLDTSNGPDLRVYLSELPATFGLHDYGERYVELGKLKGNRGDQNYAIPAGTDLLKYRSLVIWCVRFKVGFAVAPLDR